MPTTKETSPDDFEPTLCALADDDDIRCDALATSSGLCKAHDATHYLPSKQGVCGVGQCVLKVFGKGMCKAHYMRAWRIDQETDKKKRRAMRKKMGHRVLTRPDKPQKFESVTIRVTKSAARQLKKRFPSLYAGARDIIEDWAQRQAS